MSAETKTFVIHIALILGILAAAWVLSRVNHLLFRKIQERYVGLHLRFFERVISGVILIGGLILAFSVFGGIGSVWKTLLGGTAIVSAVLAFAAQDVIKDILAGLMISLYKPFEIGNRVMLEDGTAGIIRDITMRHVVIQTMDTQTVIIPNSKLNAMSIKNFSYHADTRSAEFRFHIAYGSDVEKAMEVVRDAVTDSEYSIPGLPTDHGPDYAPVYFMAFEDSSLCLATTVYFDVRTPSAVLISDVNLRVARALAKNGIEIPFQYINVIQKEEAGGSSRA